MPLKRADLLVSALLLALPRAARACAVCFGKSDDPGTVWGFYLGGAVLLVCVFSILGAAIAWIVRMERRRNEAFERAGLLKEGSGSPERWPL